jgi:hypothetical protein
MVSRRDRRGFDGETFTYDLMGRQTAQSDYASNGTSVVFSRASTFNVKGQQITEITNTVRGSDTSTAASTYSHNGLRHQWHGRHQALAFDAKMIMFESEPNTI